MIHPAEALQDTIKLLEKFRYISGGVDVVVLFFLSPDIIEQQGDSKDVTHLSTKPTEGDMRGIHALSVLTTHVKMSHNDDLNVLNIQPFGTKEALPGLLSSCTRGILSGDLKKLRKRQKTKKILPIHPDSIALPPPPKTLLPVQQAGKMPFPASQPAPLSRNTAPEIESDMPLKQQAATAPAQAVMLTNPPSGLPPAQVRIGPQPPSAIPKYMTQRPPPPPILKNPPMPKYNPLPKGWQDTLPALPTRSGNLPSSRLTAPPLSLSPPPQQASLDIAGGGQDFKQRGPGKAMEITAREIHLGQATQTEIGSGHPKRGYEAKPATKPASDAYDPYGTGPVSAVMDLLPYCTTQTKLLGRAEVISFSDVAGSLREVVLLALRDSGVEDEVMGGLEGALGPDGAKGVREFWRNEWAVD